MLTLVRGLPGSGKSTYAKSLNIFHVEADMYFIRNGKYTYNREDIGYAHSWCYETFTEAIVNLLDVVVSNTFTTKKEIEQYITFAELYDCDYQIITLTSNFGSAHGVPKETVNRMKQRWEDVPGEIII